jgi:translation initiation factor 1
MRLFEGTQFDIPPRCERCQLLIAECRCPPEPPARLAPEKQTAKIAVEKRKKGKVVTVVRGLSATGNDLPALLTQLKNACGAGGTIDAESALEIQGTHVERVAMLLGKLGYKVKQ